ncbi:MAG: 2-phosphosulfolactate phosphatase [Microscillaceae bacterium]|nr:2-phosphosulfolactate phosphatase [Microscillaceae bacterium]MDW8459876.1 2-phosphosulfolactate phosphatase [Cytophagales bacterium]
MQNIEVCLTPELLHLTSLEEKVVVVADILRASSCMVTAIAHGVEKIIPVAKIEECRALQMQGFLAAAERDGKKIQGFDLDNSPFSYMQPSLAGKTIAITTTNGTQAIAMSKNAHQVIIGAFLNKTAIVKHILSQNRDVVIVCAGWKGKVNLEDTLFAGAVLTAVMGHFHFENDAALLAYCTYQYSKHDLLVLLANSSHFHRLNKLGHSEDIFFCLSEDKYDVIPALYDNVLMKLQP